jgi:hypothetical protein
MDWPKVWVLFATYKRTVAAVNTICSLGKYLKYPNIHFHICDDGSGSTDDGTDRWHVGVLADAFSKFYPEVTWHEMDTQPGQFNTGGNINRGIRLAQQNGCSIYTLNFDDWALTRELDISPMVDVLDNVPAVGFIRLSYHVPGHGMLSVRYDAPRLNKGYMWLRIIRDWSLHNQWYNDTYLVSTQPYVAHVRFHEAYGWHPESVTPGESEIGLGNQYNSGSESQPQVLFPIGEITVHAPWDHLVGRANDYARV